MTRVLYLTWGEVPRLSSVYGGQVVEMVSALQRHPRIDHAALIAGFPLVHSGFAREKWRYHRQLAAIRDRIGTANFVTRRIPVPPVGVHPQPWQVPFFTAGQHAFLARQIIGHRADVLQCRSYIAAHLALEVRSRYDLDVKIVFDARSLMPEEGCVTGRWRKDSRGFAFWKRVEKQILAAADAATAVSKPMLDRFVALGVDEATLIYLSANVEDLDAARIHNTDRLDAGAPVVAYAGYLAEGSWHVPDNLWRAFAEFRRHSPAARLLVITKSDHSALKKSLKKFGMPDMEEAIAFTSAGSPAETVRLLQDADLAVLSYRTPENTLEHDLAESVFATKSAEYLTAGLPLMVNHYCGGARDYVLSHDAGVSYDPETGPTAEQVALLLRQARDRSRISRDAREDFSITNNADRLVTLYEKLLTGRSEGPHSAEV